jgi:hypothetical protein
MILAGIYQYLGTVSGVTSLLGTPTQGQGGGLAIYFTAAPKGPATPFLVIHRIDSPPAAQTLDGVSALLDGELQFDSYAADAVDAEKLSRAVRNTFCPLGGPNYKGTLADGTSIQFTEVTADLVGGYEQGDTGYLFRSILRLAAMYTEGS